MARAAASSVLHERRSRMTWRPCSMISRPLGQWLAVARTPCGSRSSRLDCSPSVSSMSWGRWNRRNCSTIRATRLDLPDPLQPNAMTPSLTTVSTSGWKFGASSKPRSGSAAIASVGRVGVAEVLVIIATPRVRQRNVQRKMGRPQMLAEV